MRSWPTPHVPLIPGHGRPLRLHSDERGDSAVAAPGQSATVVACTTIRRSGTTLEQVARLVVADLVVRAWRDAGVEVKSLVVVLPERVDDASARPGTTGTPEPGPFAELALDLTALGVVAPDHVTDSAELRTSVVGELERLLDAGLAMHSADVAGGVILGALGSAVLVGRRTRVPDGAGEVERARDLVTPDDVVVWRGPLPPRAGEGPPRVSERTTSRGRPRAAVEGHPTDPMVCAVAVSTHLSGSCDVVVWDAEPAAAGDTVALLRVLTGGADPVRCVLRTASSGAVGEPRAESDRSGRRANGAVGASRAESDRSVGRATGAGGESRPDTRDGGPGRPPSVAVSDLLERGVPPTAIRLALLARRYRDPPVYGAEQLDGGVRRLRRWTAAVSGNGGPAVDGLLEELRAALADDLDTPRALLAVDAWADSALSYGLPGGIADEDMVEGAPGVAARAVDALLGVRL